MAWYSSNYQNRQQITIAGTADGAQTNYQLKLTVYKGSGSSSGAVVYLNTKCKDDFSDLIFTKSDGTSPLDYWIESSVSGTSAVVWIEFDSIPISPNTVNFYIYYNYASAVSASNGDTTFKFFDHFDGSSLDAGRWPSQTTGGTGSISVTGSELTLSSGGTNGRVDVSSSTQTPDIKGKLEAKVYWTNTYTASGQVRLRARASPTAFDVGSFSPSANGLIQAYYNGWSSVGVTLGAYSRFTESKDGSNKIGKWFDSSGNLLYTGTVSTAELYDSVYLNAGDNNGVGVGSYKLDWVFVRNFTANEPTWGTWGAEETYYIAKTSYYPHILAH